MSPTAIRRALEARLAGLTVDVAPTKITYTGEPRQEWTVTVFCGPETPENKDWLDQLIAPDGEISVKAALEEDRSLGELVSDIDVVANSGYRSIEREGVTHLCSTWTVLVLP